MARDHTLGGAEAISGSHWAEKLPRNTWILQLGATTVYTTRVTGTKPAQAFVKENVLTSFSRLCLHYPWEKNKKERTGCDAEALNIKVSSSLLLQTTF